MNVISKISFNTENKLTVNERIYQITVKVDKVLCKLQTQVNIDR